MKYVIEATVSRKVKVTVTAPYEDAAMDRLQEAVDDDYSSLIWGSPVVDNIYVVSAGPEDDFGTLAEYGYEEKRDAMTCA